MTLAQNLNLWADSAPLALALVDHDQRLHWCNRAAANLFSEPGTFQTRAGRLAPSHDLYQPAFTSLIRSAAAAPEFRIIGLRRHAPCLVIAQRLSPPCDDRVMLILRQDAQKRWQDGLAMAELAPLFRLTTTESSIVKRLMSAETPAEIAASLNIKIGTVRTHVRNIYAKMDVTSREALIMRCLVFAWLDTPH